MHSLKIISKSLSLLAVFLPVLSYAAPELIVTWKASSYVPANYAGKALPVAGTAIDVSAILVDGNAVVSLSPYDINWYAGEDRVAGGKGAASARVTAPITGQSSIELRVNVAKYKNQPLDAFVTIPIVRPELLVMRKPNVKTQDLSVIPYFWNILTPAELVVTWEDNGNTVIARAVSKKNEMEFARMSIPKQ
ncbi:MAG: hypothetical protein Q7R63_01470 [bacterium]|nr:hypothetical protein [bacterium]